jgi:hypothetical protein
MGTAHKFGALCLIFKDGNSYFSDGSDCGRNVLGSWSLSGPTQTLLFTKNYNYNFLIANNTIVFYYPLGCSRRILIERELSSNKVFTPSWYYTVTAFIYIFYLVILLM